MKTVFLGATRFSTELLEHLYANGVEVAALFTIPRVFSISYSDKPVTISNYDERLVAVAERHGTPVYEVESGERPISAYADVIAAIKPDVILVMGWYYMVPRRIRELARLGAWGIHASLLPRYAGGAPLVWAMINGERETGVTLFRLDDGVDDGDIIEQQSFAIEADDTIREVYAKATVKSKEILLRALSTDEPTFTPQDRTRIEVWPQRKPEDGAIDWSWTPERIRNFIRAQTRPYPGAFTIINGKRVTIWDAEVDACDESSTE